MNRLHACRPSCEQAGRVIAAAEISCGWAARPARRTASVSAVRGRRTTRQSPNGIAPPQGARREDDVELAAGSASRPTSASRSITSSARKTSHVRPSVAPRGSTAPSPTPTPATRCDAYGRYADPPARRHRSLTTCRGRLSVGRRQPSRRSSEGEDIGVIPRPSPLTRPRPRRRRRVHAIHLQGEAASEHGSGTTSWPRARCTRGGVTTARRPLRQ